MNSFEIGAIVILTLAVLSVIVAASVGYRMGKEAGKQDGWYLGRWHERELRSRGGAHG